MEKNDKESKEKEKLKSELLRKFKRSPEDIVKIISIPIVIKLFGKIFGKDFASYIEYYSELFFYFFQYHPIQGLALTGAIAHIIVDDEPSSLEVACDAFITVIVINAILSSKIKFQQHKIKKILDRGFSKNRIIDSRVREGYIFSSDGKLFYEVVGNPPNSIEIFKIREGGIKLKKYIADVLKIRTDKEIKQFLLDNGLINVTECMIPDLQE